MLVLTLILWPILCGFAALIFAIIVFRECDHLWGYGAALDELVLLNLFLIEFLLLNKVDAKICDDNCLMNGGGLCWCYDFFESLDDFASYNI